MTPENHWHELHAAQMAYSEACQGHIAAAEGIRLRILKLIGR